MKSNLPPESTRLNEWFVPKFGPRRFRAFVGMLFLPYTGMCISFALTGSLLVNSVQWDRVAAIGIIYALALGVSAHAADALGSRKIKPWSRYFSRRELVLMILLPIAISYSLGVYYIVNFVPLLGIFAVLEGFFLFAYNFELFKGLFHNDFFFSVSWGALPVLAGYSIQGAQNWALAAAVAGVAGLVSFYHISLSRPYKEIRRSKMGRVELQAATRFETRLKSLSCSVVAVGIALVLIRWILR